MTLDEPLNPVDAKKAIKAVLTDGTVEFSAHGRKEMANDNMSERDVQNVLRGGYCDPAEEASGTWRYRVHTQMFCVVVAFRSEEQLVVVTAWRKKQ